MAGKNRTRYVPTPRAAPSSSSSSSPVEKKEDLKSLMVGLIDTLTNLRYNETVIANRSRMISQNSINLIVNYMLPLDFFFNANNLSNPEWQSKVLSRAMRKSLTGIIKTAEDELEKIQAQIVAAAEDAEKAKMLKDTYAELEKKYIAGPSEVTFTENTLVIAQSKTELEELFADTNKLVEALANLAERIASHPDFVEASPEAKAKIESILVSARREVQIRQGGTPPHPPPAEGGESIKTEEGSKALVEGGVGGLPLTLTSPAENINQ